MHVQGSLSAFYWWVLAADVSPESRTSGVSVMAVARVFVESAKVYSSVSLLSHYEFWNSILTFRTGHKTQGHLNPYE